MGLLSGVSDAIGSVTRSVGEVYQKGYETLGSHVIAPQIGMMTAGAIDPSVFGFKSEDAQKYYNLGGAVGQVGATTVAGAYAGPAGAEGAQTFFGLTNQVRYGDGAVSDPGPGYDYSRQPANLSVFDSIFTRYPDYLPSGQTPFYQTADASGQSGGRGGRRNKEAIAPAPSFLGSLFQNPMMLMVIGMFGFMAFIILKR